MIWADFHTHLGRSRDGAAFSLRSLLRVMRSYHIRHAVVFPIDEKNPGPSYERLNSRLIRIVKRYPSLLGFMRLDPRTGSRALAELKRCVRAGLGGIKLHPRSEGFSSREAQYLFPEIAGRKLPVILHTSHEKDCTPSEWEPIFRRYREIPFILAHAGKDCYQEAAALVRKYGHLYLETSTLSYFRTQTLLQIAGARKVLFASDVPYSHPAVEIRKFELAASPRERQQIFMDNGRRFFKEWMQKVW